MKWTGLWHCAAKTTGYRCLHAIAWESLSPVDIGGAVAGELADGAQALFRFYLKVDASGATKHLVLENKEILTGRPVGFDKLDKRILDATKKASDFIVAMHEEAEWEIGSSLVLRPEVEKSLRALSPTVLTGSDAMDEGIKRVIDAAGVVATAPVEAPPPAAGGVCPACNAPVKPEAKFCIECGARCQPAGAAAPKIDGAQTTADDDEGFALATLIAEWARAGGNPSPKMEFSESGDHATYTFGINENGAVFRNSIEAHRNPEKAIVRVYLPSKVPEERRARASKLLAEVAPDGFMNLDAESGEVSWIGRRPVSDDNPLTFEDIDSLFNMAWEEAIKAFSALQELAENGLTSNDGGGEDDGFALATLITEWARVGGNPSPEMQFSESGDVATYKFGINENGAVFQYSIDAHRDPEMALFKVYLPVTVPEEDRARASEILLEVDPDEGFKLDAETGVVVWLGERAIGENPLTFEEIDGIVNIALDESLKAFAALTEAAESGWPSAKGSGENLVFEPIGDPNFLANAAADNTKSLSAAILADTPDRFPVNLMFQDEAYAFLLKVDEIRKMLSSEKFAKFMNNIRFHQDISVTGGPEWAPRLLPNGSIVIRNFHRLIGLSGKAGEVLAVDQNALLEELSKIVSVPESGKSLTCIHHELGGWTYKAGLPAALSRVGQTLIHIPAGLDLTKSDFLSNSRLPKITGDSFGAMIRTFANQSFVYSLERISDNLDSAVETIGEELEYAGFNLSSPRNYYVPGFFNDLVETIRTTISDGVTVIDLLPENVGETARLVKEKYVQETTSDFWRAVESLPRVFGGGCSLPTWDPEHSANVAREMLLEETLGLEAIAFFPCLDEVGPDEIQRFVGQLCARLVNLFDTDDEKLPFLCLSDFGLSLERTGLIPLANEAYFDAMSELVDAVKGKFAQLSPEEQGDPDALATILREGVELAIVIKPKLPDELNEIDRIALQSMGDYEFAIAIPAYGIYQEYDHGERGEGNIASFIVE